MCDIGLSDPQNVRILDLKERALNATMKPSEVRQRYRDGKDLSDPPAPASDRPLSLRPRSQDGQSRPVTPIEATSSSGRTSLPPTDTYEVPPPKSGKAERKLDKMSTQLATEVSRGCVHTLLHGTPYEKSSGAEACTVCFKDDNKGPYPASLVKNCFLNCSNHTSEVRKRCWQIFPSTASGTFDKNRVDPPQP